MVVRQHAARLRRAEPVLLFEDDAGRRFLVDGYHRLAAARKRRFTALPAEIRPGSYDDALRCAGERSRWELAAAEKEELRRYREDSDLPVDEAVIRRLFRLSAYAGRHYTTPEEAARIAPLEAAVEAARAPVAAYTDRHPESYAGRWVGRTRGEPTFYVAFTGSLEPHRRALALPQVEVVGARRTLAELEAIQDAIGDGALPIHWTLVGVDMVENVVEVGVRDGDEAATRALLHARYGDAVRLEWGVSVIAT